MKRYLKFLVLADLHGNIKALQSIISSIKLDEIDAIFIAGDLPITTPNSLILHYFLTHGNLNREGYSNWVYKGKGRSIFVKKQLESIGKIEKILSKLDKQTFYVSGNVDTVEVVDYLKRSSVITLVNNSTIDQKFSLDDKINIFGIGGSLIHIGKGICDGEFSEKEFNDKLSQISRSIKENSIWILLTHEPPYFEKNQLLRIKSSNKELYKYDFKREGGSRNILLLVKEKTPLLVISGHYHEYTGSTRINNVEAVNPGCAAVYQYAIINIELNEKNPKIIETNFFRAKKRKFDFIKLMYSQRDSQNLE